MFSYFKDVAVFTITTGKYWIAKIAALLPDWLSWSTAENRILALSHLETMPFVDTGLVNDSITPLLSESVISDIPVSHSNEPQLITPGNVNFSPIDSNTNRSTNNINFMQSAVNGGAISEVTILGLLGVGLYWKHKLKIAKLKRYQQKLLKESQDQLQLSQQENQLLKRTIDKIAKQKEKLQKRLQYKEQKLQESILQHQIEINKKDKEISEAIIRAEDRESVTATNNLQIRLNDAIQRIQNLEDQEQTKERSEIMNASPKILHVPTDQSTPSLHSQPSLQSSPATNEHSNGFLKIMSMVTDMESTLGSRTTSSPFKDVSRNNHTDSPSAKTGTPILPNFNSRLATADEPVTHTTTSDLKP